MKYPAEGLFGAWRERLPTPGSKTEKASKTTNSSDILIRLGPPGKNDFYIALMLCLLMRSTSIWILAM